MGRAHSDGGAASLVRGSIPSSEKVDHAFYQTAPRGTMGLLTKEELEGIVWECACGKGMMSEVLLQRGPVISTDLVDRGYGRTGVDFLTFDPDFDYDHIVTNPPYPIVLPFVRRAISLRRKKVAMLIRLNWLAGKSATELLSTSGLTKLYVFSGRLNLPRESRREEFGDKGGMVDYAWYVWHRGYRGKPQVEWIT